MSGRTRFADLNYRQDAPGLWRFVATDTESSVGPHYASKAELLADLERYATVYGCNGDASELLAISRNNLMGVNAELRTEIETLRASLAEAVGLLRRAGFALSDVADLGAALSILKENSGSVMAARIVAREIAETLSRLSGDKVRS